MSSARPDRPTTMVPDTDRRRFLTVLAAAGAVASTRGLPLLGADAPPPQLTESDIAAAERLAGLEFTDAERALMLKDVSELTEKYAELRTVNLANSTAPALEFHPRPGREPLPSNPEGARWRPSHRAELPERFAEIAFLPVTALAALIKSRKISSLDLTKIYLERLESLGPRLECVITVTQKLALEQAARADREIRGGRYRGPLHGIPWGAKDLLSARGYPTTWGAAPFKDQVIDQDATVVAKLEAAGAVLVAKLTLGALAWGDVWYGGKTRNPWNLEQGSSGSSAGPASATAAGLVGFSIGSETWGSIVSPSTRCGATGLRPTFGLVSRHGAMALSWSMDKLGPICRSVGDCALVLEAIAGPDGLDTAVGDRTFRWEPTSNLSRLRIGYVPDLFEAELENDDDDAEAIAAAAESRAFDLRSLETLRALGVDLIPIELPKLPIRAMSFILSAEAAAAFDDLTRSGRDDLLVRQIESAWPNVFRQAHLIPAVEYIQANRVRTLVMQQMTQVFSKIDAYVTPSFGGDNLLMTNLTGHPAVVLPNGFRADGTPTSITFTGDLFGETPLVNLARSYQEATDFHLQHPALEAD